MKADPANDPIGFIQHGSSLSLIHSPYPYRDYRNIRMICMLRMSDDLDPSAGKQTVKQAAKQHFLFFPERCQTGFPDPAKSRMKTIKPGQIQGSRFKAVRQDGWKLLTVGKGSRPA